MPSNNRYRATVIFANNSAKYASKAIVGLGQWATTDHTGSAKHIANIPSLGFFNTIALLTCVSCSYLGSAIAQTTIPAGSTMTVPGVAMNLACTDLVVQGTLIVGAAQINQSATVGIASGGQLNAGQGTITVGGNWNNSGTFSAGTSTVVMSDICSNAQVQLTGNTTFYNLNLTSGSGKTFVFPAGSNITVTGTLRLQGTPGTPIRLISGSGQPVSITLAQGAQLINTNAEIGQGVSIVNSAPSSIPTLSEYALVLLSLLIFGSTYPILQRKKFRG